jgi:hypothetical protein
MSLLEVPPDISTELAPQVAIALLATIATSRVDRDGLAPALGVLAAAVVASSSAKRVRMHLLFEQRSVLPLENSLDAALALERGLAAELTSVLNAH